MSDASLFQAQVEDVKQLALEGRLAKEETRSLHRVPIGLYRAVRAKRVHEPGITSCPLSTPAM